MVPLPRCCAAAAAAAAASSAGVALVAGAVTLPLPHAPAQVSSLREIQALRRLSPHPNIIALIEVLYDQPTGRLALVFELMQQNIYELIRGRRHYLNENRVKSYMYQLIKAVDHMHRNGIFHRDIKPVREAPSASLPRAAAVANSALLCYAGEHFNRRGRAQTRGLRLLPRHLQQTAVHRIHLSTVVSSPRVPVDERVLQLQDGYLGHWLRVLRDSQPLSAVPWHE
eukprot:COSAG05_NODE_212_length_13942_cov_18.039659_4_plen_226_part_00